MPTAEEYARIEEQYYAFPGDKDAFCRAWKRANPAAVNAAKEAKRLAAKRDRLFTLLCKIDKGSKNCYRDAYDVLKPSEIRLLAEHGIRPMQNWKMDDVCFSISQYLKRAAV